MFVHYKRARAAGQQPAGMMNVHAALERIGGERKVSLVKKGPAQHNEQEVVPHVEPVEAPARAETAPQPPPKKKKKFSSMDMESHSFISDLAMVFDFAVESEDTGFDDASTCDEGARQHPCEAETKITSFEVDHVVVKLRLPKTKLVGSQSLWSMAN